MTESFAPMRTTWLLTVLLALTGCERSVAPDLAAVGSTPVSKAPAAPQAAPSAPATGVRVFSFDSDEVDRVPTGFAFARTGSGALGRWLVRADATAPSPPNVLAQLDGDGTSFRFPVAVVPDVRLRDVRVSVKCKMVSGRVDQACGLVARYRDESNYLLTRANALEGNVRLYFVRDGERKQLASYSGSVERNRWHEHRFEVRGADLAVFWDGERVLRAREERFDEPGRVGVWTKADSVSSFDELRVEPL
jgi:hypothetical protein